MTEQELIRIESLRLAIAYEALGTTGRLPGYQALTATMRVFEELITTGVLAPAPRAGDAY